jgi:hypothetical protein
MTSHSPSLRRRLGKIAFQAPILSVLRLSSSSPYLLLSLAEVGLLLGEVVVALMWLLEKRYRQTLAVATTFGSLRDVRHPTCCKSLALRRSA